MTRHFEQPLVTLAQAASAPSFDGPSSLPVNFPQPPICGAAAFRRPPFDAQSVRKRKVPTVIKTDLLIPGDGEPISDAALVIEDKLIAWVGAATDLPKHYIEKPHRAVTIPVLMPGLWECHAHFFAAGPESTGDDNYVSFVTLQPAASGARLARWCWESVMNGYTSVRDLAGHGCEVAKAVNDGTIMGPNIYSSGAIISQLGGHGDSFSMPPDVISHSLGVSNDPLGISCIANGVDEVRKATRLQIRRGAKLIKVAAGGGIMSRDDDVTCAQYSQEELECIVAEAKRQKRIVAAHTHSKEGILAAIRAGVTTIEHGSFADEECIKLMKEKGTVFVPTRGVLEFNEEDLKLFPPSSAAKLRECSESHLKACKLALKSGVNFAMGLDTLPGLFSAMELEFAVKFGMSTLDAIKAATANGPLTVGAQAPLTGQLKAGYEADVLGLTANPVEDIRVLQQRDNIPWVWKGGKVMKGPGVGPWGEE